MSQSAYDAWRTAGPDEWFSESEDHGRDCRCEHCADRPARCEDCGEDVEDPVMLDGDPWCKACAIALLPKLGTEERAETLAALADAFGDVSGDLPRKAMTEAEECAQEREDWKTRQGIFAGVPR